MYLHPLTSWPFLCHMHVITHKLADGFVVPASKEEGASSSLVLFSVTSGILSTTASISHSLSLFFLALSALHRASAMHGSMHAILHASSKGLV